MKLIINADDFGFSNSINKGIIDCYKEGLISTTSIMINMPYAEDAINLWKDNIGLGLGLHINITQGRPISNNVPSLVDSNGNFIFTKDMENHIFNEEELYREIKAQLEKLKSYDVVIDHIDWHHALADNELFVKIFLNIAKEYNLPVRTYGDKMREYAKDLNVITTDKWCETFFKTNANYQVILDYVLDNKDASSIEIMTHVGYIDEDTKKRTSYIDRDKEIIELKKLKNMGFYDTINLVRYKDL